jgi:hypothetical protein
LGIELAMGAVALLRWILVLLVGVTIAGCTGDAKHDATPLADNGGPLLCGGTVPEAAAKKATGADEILDSGNLRRDLFGHCTARAGEKIALTLDIYPVSVEEWRYKHQAEIATLPKGPADLGSLSYVQNGQVVVYRDGLDINLWIMKHAKGRDAGQDGVALLRLVLARLQIDSGPSPSPRPT